MEAPLLYGLNDLGTGAREARCLGTCPQNTVHTAPSPKLTLKAPLIEGDRDNEGKGRWFINSLSDHLQIRTPIISICPPRGSSHYPPRRVSLKRRLDPGVTVWGNPVRSESNRMQADEKANRVSGHIWFPYLWTFPSISSRTTELATLG